MTNTLNNETVNKTIARTIASKVIKTDDYCCDARLLSFYVFLQRFIVVMLENPTGEIVWILSFIAIRHDNDHCVRYKPYIININVLIYSAIVLSLAVLSYVVMYMASGWI